MIAYKLPLLNSTNSAVTSTIFDIGVYIIVVGLVLDVLRSLGSEIDERAESDDPVAEDTGADALVPPATEAEGVRP